MTEAPLVSHVLGLIETELASLRAEHRLLTSRIDHLCSAARELRRAENSDAPRSTRLSPEGRQRIVDAQHKRRAVHKQPSAA